MKRFAEGIIPIFIILLLFILVVFFGEVIADYLLGIIMSIFSFAGYVLGLIIIAVLFFGVVALVAKVFVRK